MWFNLNMASADTPQNRPDTETHCHCGAEYHGCDHCPECACEQYESGDCGYAYTPDEDDD